MIKSIKENRNFQLFFRFLNYYSSLMVLSLIVEAPIRARSIRLSNLYEIIRSIIFPRDFSTILFIVVVFMSLFILDFKRNKLIKVSFTLNLILLIIVGIVSLALYTNS